MTLVRRKGIRTTCNKRAKLNQTCKMNDTDKYFSNCCVPNEIGEDRKFVLCHAIGLDGFAISASKVLKREAKELFRELMTGFYKTDGRPGACLCILYRTSLGLFKHHPILTHSIIFHINITTFLFFTHIHCSILPFFCPASLHPSILLSSSPSSHPRTKV